MSLTGTDNYFEDFVPGEMYQHARGRTVTETDNVALTLLVMNTAQGHFNEDRMRETSFGQRLVFGGVTTAIIVGLAAQDTAEQAIAEVGLDRVRFRSPVFHGDTLYAFSEVVSVAPGERTDAGLVTFRHWGVNQRDEIVFEGERTVLLRRRPTEVRV